MLSQEHQRMQAEIHEIYPKAIYHYTYTINLVVNLYQNSFNNHIQCKRDNNFQLSNFS